MDLCVHVKACKVATPRPSVRQWHNRVAWLRLLLDGFALKLREMPAEAVRNLLHVDHIKKHLI